MMAARCDETMTTPHPDSPVDGGELDILRAWIDALDHELLQLLSRRNGLVAEVARTKREHNRDIRDPEREESLLADRRQRASQLGLSPEVIESIYRLILWASRDRQASLKAQVPLDEEPKTIAIIGGSGGMGKCMASLFADLGHAVMIADLDTDLTPQNAAQQANVVLISVPITETIEVIRTLGPRLREDALLMDVTSTKTAPLRAMLESHPGPVLGTHPLFGPSLHSFQGQRIALIPGRNDEWLHWGKRMFQARGLITVESTAEEHDRIMGVVQVLTHFSTEVMGRTLVKLKKTLGVSLSETLQFTSPVYLLEMLMTARHFAQSPDLYAAIQSVNPETPQITTAFREALNEWIDIAQPPDDLQDSEQFNSAFREVSEYFGSFSKQALDQSGYLIDRLVERL